MNIISRAEAIARGLNKFFTGKPCKRGHISEKYVDNYGCVQCTAQRAVGYSKTEAGKERQRISNQKQATRSQLRWRQSDHGRIVRNAIKAKSRASKLQRTPFWSETKEIKQFYQNCPPGYEVDHILPLQGELVSGLHVLSNLQYLTSFENRSKNNHFNPMDS